MLYEVYTDDTALDLHSTHETLDDAIDQADMIRGKVYVDGYAYNPDSDAYHIGYAAAKSGDDINPYDACQGPEHTMWKLGHAAADE